MQRRQLLIALAASGISLEAQEPPSGSLYIPKPQLVDDRKFLHDFMDEYAFADLVTAAPGIRITHIPVFLDRSTSQYGTVYGHISRQNPQSKIFDGRTPAVIVFRGPDSYISPRWYNKPEAVPTWNFAVVAFYRRAVAAIRAVDERHMVFLDGNRYAREFPGFGEPFENAVYAIHQYPEPGAADGGPYPGDSAGRYVDYGVVEAEFQAMTGYMRERDLPVWVGEFGPVYGAGAERDAQRRRLLADQIGIYEAAGAGWSVWTYKDIGVQGLTIVDPASPWLARTEAVRAKKNAVAADHWGMTTDGMRDVLEPLMARFSREFPGWDPYPFGARRNVEQLVLSICFAEPLADEFAACFADATDEELAALGMSFAFGNCVVQKELCEVVSLNGEGKNP